MDKNLIRGVVYRTVILVVVIFSFNFFLNHNGLVYQKLKLDLFFLLNPLLLTSIMIYAASILNILLTGEFSDVIVHSILSLAAGLFFSMTIMDSPTPELYRPIGLWLLIGVIVLVFKSVASAASKSYDADYLKILSTSISLLAEGYVLNQIIHIVIEPFSFLGTIVFCSFATISAISLLKIFDGSRNPYLSYLGEKLAGSYGLGIIFVLVISLLLYFSALRPIIMNYYAFCIVPAEWAIVCLASFIIYRSIKSYVEKSLVEDLRLGEWTTLIQKIVYKKGNIEKVTGLVERFVEDGHKEGIIVYLISTLLENGVSPLKIETVIKRLVEYKNNPPSKLMFTWRLKKMEKENKARRADVLRSTLDEAGRVVQAPSMIFLKGLEESA